ncbi:MAG: hypothetical protein H6735_33970, partial [Alphaproteobacteria bacterium]|nr:hypothetical protein [Alphaproteobacteria bacterium]
IEAHAAAVTAARASLTIGATTPGVLGSRVKGGHRVRIGPLTAFLPLGRWHGNGPAPVAFRVVKIARTLVVEPAADQVVAPAEVLEPVPLAAQTLATLVTWSGATALVHDALDGPASEQVFDVLLRHRPLRAAAWVSTHRPPHERGWRLRLELGVAAGEAEWIEALEARAPVRQAALRGLRHRPLTPRVVRSLREDGDRIDVGAERLLAEAGEEPWTRLAEIADDDTQRPAVRGAALRCLPPELAVQRCGAWLAHPRLARYAAEALADLGDQASLTMLLRASLDPALPCPSETLSRL